MAGWKRILTGSTDSEEMSLTIPADDVGVAARPDGFVGAVGLVIGWISAWLDRLTTCRDFELGTGRWAYTGWGIRRLGPAECRMQRRLSLA